METPAQRIARLVIALEDLTRQESLQFRSGDYGGVLRTQLRAAPLVECLAGLGAAAAGEASRVRVASVVEQRRQSEEWLSAALARSRDELRQMQSNQRRLSQVRPAYAGPVGGGQQLRALG